MCEKAAANSDQTFDITLDIDISKRTSELADENRRHLDAHDVRCLDVMGSVGCGKTTLITQLLRRLNENVRPAVIAGDLTTRIDAERMEAEGVPVLQIQTGGMCHLDAHLVRQALDKFRLDDLDLIVIENVGNLICPAGFPVGAHQRLVILSVTEGPYMVRKHPIMINQAEVAVINKVDLAEAMQVSVDELASDLQEVKPGIKVVATNAREGEGVDEVLEALGL